MSVRRSTKATRVTACELAAHVCASEMPSEARLLSYMRLFESYIEGWSCEPVSLEVVKTGLQDALG